MSINLKVSISKYSRYYEYLFLKSFKFDAQSHGGVSTTMFLLDTQDPVFTEPNTQLSVMLQSQEDLTV